MSSAKNEIVEGAWLVEHNLSFVGYLSLGQCKGGHDLSLRCCVRCNVACDLMPCATWCCVRPGVVCDLIVVGHDLLSPASLERISLTLRSCVTKLVRARLIIVYELCEGLI